MDYVIIMGMEFESGSEPDFGSIYRVHEGVSGVHEYGLNSEDVDKLDIITNAAPGSTALCDDTADIYRLTKTGWVMFGAGSQAGTSDSTNSVSLSFAPVSIDRPVITDDITETDDIDGELV